MIIKESCIQIIDNSGFSSAKCIHVYGGFKNRFGSVGDFILVSVKSNLKRKRLEKKLYLALIATSAKNIERLSGIYIKFDLNQILLFEDKENLLGTKLLNPIDMHLRKNKLLRVPLTSRNFI